MGFCYLLLLISNPVLRSKRDIFGIIFHITPLKRMLQPSLEPSRRDDSNKGSQHMFSLRNKKKLSLKFPQYPLLSGALHLTSCFSDISQQRWLAVWNAAANETNLMIFSSRFQVICLA